MFILRLTGVALSVFIVAYLALSLLIVCTWKLVRKQLRGRAPFRAANLIFALRLFPLAAAIAITCLYAVPSFLILEPTQIQEPLGLTLMALSAIALSWLLIATLRTMSAHQTASDALSRWIAGASPQIDHGTEISTLRLASTDPVLTVAGICAPKILVSERAMAVLTPEELQAALRHELAHIRRRDNLKKLLFRFVSFPKMTEVESTWSEISEMAADDAAISSPSEALDLASALIKLSRFAPVQTAYTIASDFFGTAASLEARVQRLFEWSDQDEPTEQSRAYLWSVLLTSFCCAVVTYSQVLSGMHVFTEWLVR